MEVNLTKKFEEIYGSLSDAIFRFCLLRVSNREQALDITQETFVRLWQSLQNGEEIKNNKAFLFTIARRLIIDWYRRKKSFSLDDMFSFDDGSSGYDVIEEGTDSDGLVLKAEGRYLLDKINELSPSSRDPVYLRFVEYLSPPEIGKILGISVNAASVRVNRGLAELRKIVGDNESLNKKNDKNKKIYD